MIAGRWGGGDPGKIYEVEMFYSVMFSFFSKTIKVETQRDSNDHRKVPSFLENFLIFRRHL